MPNKESLTSVRLGSSVTFDGRKLTGSTLIPGTATPRILPNHDAPLLEVDLTGTDQGFGSGSWVLTLDADAKFEGNTAAGVCIVPLVAHVTLGTGGGAISFDVDVKNNSFQLPASNVKVTVGWDRSIPAVLDPFPDQSRWVIPREVTIRGALQRGVSGAFASRTLYLPMGGGTAGSAVYEVPNYAKCVRVWAGDRTSAWFQSTVSSTGSVHFYAEQATGGAPAGSSLITSYMGERFANPSGLNVPNLAQVVSVVMPTPGPVPRSLEFDVSL